MAFAGCPADVLHDPLRRRFSVYGFLSHLHSLMVTMSQKSSATQATKSVSQALMPDKTRSGKRCQSPAVNGKRRCRMHGGAEGSGAPKGNQNALKHGQYTKRAIEERRELRRFIREADKFLEEFKS